MCCESVLHVRIPPHRPPQPNPAAQKPRYLAGPQMVEMANLQVGLVCPHALAANHSAPRSILPAHLCACLPSLHILTSPRAFPAFSPSSLIANFVATAIACLSPSSRPPFILENLVSSCGAPAPITQHYYNLFADCYPARATEPTTSRQPSDRNTICYAPPNSP